MTKSQCLICGGDASTLTPLGSRLCDSCNSKYEYFTCDRCEQPASYHKDIALESQTTCYSCLRHERMAQLTPEQREKIVAHLRDNSGVILAVQEARQHFPTLNESMEVVVILREELKHL